MNVWHVALHINAVTYDTYSGAVVKATACNHAADGLHAEQQYVLTS